MPLNKNPAVTLASFFQDRESADLARLRSLCSINSFTENKHGIDELAQVLIGLYAPLGFSHEHISCSNELFGDHLLLTRRGSSGKSILLIAHLDTVFTIEEEQRCDFIWRETSEKIYAPGVIDIKGGIIEILRVLEGLQYLDRALFEETSWYVAFNAAEERATPDFAPALLTRLPKDCLACLVFETAKPLQTGFGIVTSRRGRAALRISVRGRDAHSGSEHPKGINAIQQLARLVEYISSLTDYDRDLTVNIGTIHGGTTINRVPAEAFAELEVRAFDAALLAGTMQQIEAFAGEGNVRSPLDGTAAVVTVERLSEPRAWPINDATQRLVRVWEAAAAGMQSTITIEHRLGGSDANSFWNIYPTLDGLGPDGANLHCAVNDPASGREQEFLYRPSYCRKIVLTTCAIRLLLAPGS